MNDAGDLNPTVPSTPSSPARSWLRRHRLPLVACGAVLGLGALSVSAALVLMAARPAANVEKMVPADADIMVVVNLDPSVSQKLNLVRVLHRFPQTSSDKSISDALDSALKGSGLSYSGDLRPWIGGELGFSARLNYDTTLDRTSGALYAISRNDTLARATLAKLRASATGKQLKWTDETYNGFPVSLGTPAKSTDQPAAYSLVDHVVVVTNSASLIQDIIDTEQGRAARLTDSAGYKATISGLPSDRLGLAYVSGASLMTGIKKQLAKASAASSPITGNIGDLDAFTGIGGSISASSHGINADVLVKLDQSKLSPSTRQALTSPGRPDAVLGWIPRSSDAFIAVGNLNRTIQSLIDSSKSDPSIKGSTDAFGLTGPAGVLNHLTGDAALEVQVGGGTPAGALLLRGDDPASLGAFFNKLLNSASSLTLSVTPTPRSGKPAAAARVITTSYRGISITSLAVAQPAQAALAPSYAVLDGFGVIGSNLAEVKAVIDAH
ncbi:MAG TPA: DUF3352 domain-containing protein [Candidatus Dormibacteraeota bacterium]|nr:DUF3352 domain-containing protein [Candidatus Dormibacteraeota bacterium]